MVCYRAPGGSDRCSHRYRRDRYGFQSGFLGRDPPRLLSYFTQVTRYSRFQAGGHPALEISLSIFSAGRLLPPSTDRHTPLQPSSARSAIQEVSGVLIVLADSILSASLSTARRHGAALAELSKIVFFGAIPALEIGQRLIRAEDRAQKKRDDRDGA